MLSSFVIVFLYSSPSLTLALLCQFIFHFSNNPCHVCVFCEQSSDFSDISESAADYFSRSNRRGSIVSDLDDFSIPDLDSVSG